MKKRILIALFAGASVFGLALAFAASLGLDGGNLQAGDDVTLSCDTDGVSTSYGVSYAAGGYKIDSVTVTGINTDCDGRTVGVTLSGPTTPISVSAPYSSAGGSTSVTITVAGAPTVASITGAHAAIYS